MQSPFNIFFRRSPSYRRGMTLIQGSRLTTGIVTKFNNMLVKLKKRTIPKLSTWLPWEASNAEKFLTTYLRTVSITYNFNQWFPSKEKLYIQKLIIISNDIKLQGTTISMVIPPVLCATQSQRTLILFGFMLALTNVRIHVKKQKWLLFIGIQLLLGYL